jgi:Predicted RNA-binding protein containing KH domain, possibly ribosomal protein
MDKVKQYALKKESVDLTPLLSIGKNGITDSMVEELKKQLKVRKLVKVRIHKNSGETDDLKSALIDVRGRTVTLYKQ